MNNQRNGGMTAIGILNIVFGGIGTLLSLLALVGGGALAALGAAAESQGVDTAGATATGGIFMLISLVSLLGCVGLMIGGIGVMKLAPWGRTFSMWCGLVIALLSVYQMVTVAFNPFSAVWVLYGGVVFALFNTPAWKAAFSGQPAHASHSSPASSEYRRAA